MAKKRTGDVTSENSDSKKPAEVVSYWLNELAASRKREKDWRKEGQKILDIYDGTDAASTPFNILYSNTETMVPAVYSAIPRPVVQRRYKDDDQLGRHAALAGQRILEFLVDTNIDGYETFNEALKAATLDGMLPGRGVTGIKYDLVEGQEAATVEGEEGSPYKASELVCTDSKLWNRVLFGYAKKWSRVPWVAYEEHLDKEECERLFGENAKKIQYTTGEEEDEEAGDRERNDDEKNTGELKTALVYQIWDKRGGRKIRYVSAQYKDGFLLVQDDTLQLTGFFNCPRPLQFVEKNDREPVALYVLYENQAKELNRLTIRINRVVEAIKARGAYDKALGDDLAKIMKGDDNELVPAESDSALASEKGFQNAIWFMPLDTLVNVLDKLYVAREQCKQTIYEIMGIADIMRGASKASETLGAQEIKNQWGTLRIKPKQHEVQRYARDLLRMMLEVAATKFSEETWAQMTGLPFNTSEKAAQLQQIATAAQAQAQQMTAMGQQPTPQQMQQVQQLQAELAKPAWADVLKMLRTDTQRAYRIDIETNSTVEPEAAEDQKHIADLMNAMGQFLNGVGPLVEKGVMPFEVAKNMLLAISRRFRFGTEIEDDIKQMKAPPPPDDGKAAEAAKLQAEQQIEQARMQQEQAATAAKLQADQQAEQARVQLEHAKLQGQQAIEAAKIQAERERDAAKIDAEKQARMAELQAERATAQMKAKIDQETELQKTAMQVRAQVIIAKINAAAKAATAGAVDGEGGEATEAQPSDESFKATLRAISEPEARSLDAFAEALRQQATENREMMATMLRAITAPRRRTPTRDKTGRISEVLDEVTTIQ